MLFLVAVTMYFLLGQLNKDIVFAEKERMGLRYNNAVLEVITRVQENRRVVDVTQSGGTVATDQLQAAHSHVEQALHEVDVVEQDLANRFETQEVWAKIKAKWADLASGSAGATVQNQYDQHTALLADLLALMSRVGDKSNLILDPDLDSYYLMDATMVRLPSLAEEISQLRELGRGLDSRQGITNAETTQLIYKMAAITSGFDAIKQGATVISAQNPPLQADLEQRIHPFDQSFSAFKQELNTTYIAAQQLQNPHLGYEEKAAKTLEDIHALYQVEAKQLDQLLVERRAHYASIKYFVMSFVLVVFVLVLYVFAAFYVSIMNAIRTLSTSAHEVATGNLLIRIPVQTRDEMRDVATAFNSMMEAVKLVINSSKLTAEQVSVTSDKLVSIADQTSKANQQLALSIQESVKGADHQLSRTEESSDAINEMSHDIQRIADSTHEVSELSQTASRSAADGNKAIDKVVYQMGKIEDSVQLTAENMQELHARSKQVHQIVEVIKVIAGQTNLLALNAAIEAARVGEFGRGFTVVADETRKLAEQTAKSAEEIYDLIQQIQEASVNSVQSMDDVIQDVQRGRTVVQETNDSFQHIIASSHEIAGQIQEISSSSELMASSSEQVAATISEISAVTRDSYEQFQAISELSTTQVVVMQELGEQAHLLNQMSQSLREQIGRFTL